jgi:hypothetical protein
MTTHCAANPLAGIAPAGWAPINAAAPVSVSELPPIEGPRPEKRRADILACADALQRGVGRGRSGAVKETGLAALILYRTLNGPRLREWPVPELIAARLARLIVAVRTRPGWAPTPAAHREAVIWFRHHLGHPSALNAFTLPRDVIPPEARAFRRQA